MIQLSIAAMLALLPVTPVLADGWQEIEEVRAEFVDPCPDVLADLPQIVIDNETFDLMSDEIIDGNRQIFVAVDLDNPDREWRHVYFCRDQYLMTSFQVRDR